MPKSLFSLILIVVLTHFGTQQSQGQTKMGKQQQSFESVWRQADSLIEKGLPRSAAQTVQGILKEAHRRQDHPNAIKAQLFLLKIEQHYDENSIATEVRQLDSLAEHANATDRAIWQSIQGQYLHRYYQQNRWRLLNQTRVVGDQGSDPESWDAWALLDRISELYKSSISNTTILQETPIQDYTALLVEGKNTRNLRPTLYDLLAYRALDFFQNEERNLNRPAYQFRLDDAHWFSPATELETIVLNTDSAYTEELQFLALKTYQELLKLHLSNQRIEALVDADLRRLMFVNTYSAHPSKDSLYLTALKHIENQYSNNQGTAQATFLRLNLAHEQLSSKATLHRQLKNNPDLPQDFVELKTMLDQVAAKFPNTEGGSNAAILSRQLQEKTLHLESEEVILPGEYSKVLVTYKNADRMHLRIYPIPREKQYWEELHQTDSAWRIHSRRTSPILQWSQSLPGTYDLKQHTTEIPIEPLQSGAYLLVASLREDFSDQDNILATLLFQASSISVLANNNVDYHWLFALHRKSGMPLPGAEVQFWANVWNSKARKSEQTLLQSTRTDEEGKTRYTATESNRTSTSAVTLAYRGDSLLLNLHLNGRNTNNRNTNLDADTTTQVMLFTDRGLYRPGQTVYFKGIILQSINDGQINQTLSDQNLRVDLLSRNRQIADSLSVTSNGFGSFSGSFVLPEEGITGMMHIRTNQAQTSFQVEEYKRPRFTVAFEKDTTQLLLGERVHIRGRAEAFAGNRIDEAQVSYRVVRETYFPYAWLRHSFGSHLRSYTTEITRGHLETNNDGTFDIQFEALPDLDIPEENQPVFHYTIYADVTDSNGETRSGSTTVHAGYHSLVLQLSAPPRIDAQQIQRITINSSNLNQEHIATKIHIGIKPLLYPGKVYRKRSWSEPDQHILSETEFRTLFPEDEYRNESDYQSWKEGESTWSASLNTADSNRIDLPANIWPKSGWHLIEISATDKQGNKVVEKQYVYVVSKATDDSVQQPLLADAKNMVLAVGDPLDISLNTAFKNTYIIETNTLISPAFQVFSDHKNISKTIMEEDKGGIGYHWIFVHNNRTYQQSINIQVLFSERDLQVKWATHRDKLQPGEQETWTWTIRGAKQEAVEAELMAGLYDASLDEIRPHHWNWNRLQPLSYLRSNWSAHAGFATKRAILRRNNINLPSISSYHKRYDELYGTDYYPFYGYLSKRSTSVQNLAGSPIMDATFNAESVSASAPEMQATSEARLESELYLSGDMDADNPDKEIDIPVRQNLNETAFFSPHLQTDVNGKASFSFTVPEALTRWKMMALAHTKDWRTGYLEGHIVTQKDLMVFPNIPRFVRQGDRVFLRSKISNISTEKLEGTARIQLLDAETLKTVAEVFGTLNNLQDFSVSAGESTAVQWEVKIPTDYLRPIIVRITAQAGQFTDGEDNFLPVLTNKTLITETLPLPIRGQGPTSFTFDRLINQQSPSLVHQDLTLEFTGNPAWYAVQALPSLTESTTERADILFNKLYTFAIANYILSKNPKIREVFDQWQTNDSTSLLSPLEKNQELKNILLEATPWVLDAHDESQQKQRIAALFDDTKIAKHLEQTLQRLADMQSADGSFPWFKGMASNRYITQYITIGMLRLQHLKIEALQTPGANNILSRAIGFLDRQVEEDYKRLISRLGTSKTALSKQHITPTHIHYLYMRSLAGNAVPFPEGQDSQAGYQYYKEQAHKYWASFNPYMKGLIALILHADESSSQVKNIMASLKETATHNSEMGTYWKSLSGGLTWYQAPIEAQAQLIETFHRINPNDQIIDDMKVWLIKQKQVQKWHSTKATADAVYALLLTGRDWLKQPPAVTIQMGQHRITSDSVSHIESGTGYFQHRFGAAEINPNMGHITVNVEEALPGNTAWGAAYWQYFEDLDAVSASEDSPLKISQTLYITRNTARGPALEELAEGQTLKTGDKVSLRIVIQADRSMEFIYLNAMWAACFEPVASLSGYRYKNGLGYYESIRDQGTDLYFDYLPQGTHVLEIPVFVSQEGTFTNGVSRIQSLYAPEFGGHTQGKQINVQN